MLNGGMCNSLSLVLYSPRTSVSLIPQCHNVVASNAPPKSYTYPHSTSINRINCNPHIPFASNLLSYPSTKSHPSSQCEFDFTFPSVNVGNGVGSDNSSHINSIDHIKQPEIHRVHSENDNSFTLDTTQHTRPDSSIAPVVFVDTTFPSISQRVSGITQLTSTEQQEHSATNKPDTQELSTYPSTSSIYRSNQQRKPSR